MKKKVFGLRCFMLMAALFVAMSLFAAPKQRYAVYNSWGHSLTFYYDDQRTATRDGCSTSIPAGIPTGMKRI